MRVVTPRFPIPGHGAILLPVHMTVSPETTSPISPARAGRLRRWLRRVVIGLPLLLLAMLIARTIFFSGPIRPVEPLPQLPVIDLHCHTAGIGAGDSGALISPALRGNFRFRIYLESFGVTEAELEEHGDGLVIQRISERVAASQHVDQVVVLALDGVINDQGELDRDRTEFHMPNEFVAREVAKHTNLLWGASVNPHRRDALERLAWAKTNGAVLVKWIPSIMGIDPADQALRPFYLKLKELNLPLLTHGGQEKSFTYARDELADPVRLKLPLELGVTVIVAHIASTGSNEGQEDFERLLPMFPTYPNLYSEISSLTQANKLGYLRRTLTDERLKGRLLYGTDYPLINTALVTPWAFPLNLTRQQMVDLSAIENPFDRDVALKQALGVPAEIFTSTAKVIGRGGR